MPISGWIITITIAFFTIMGGIAISMDCFDSTAARIVVWLVVIAIILGCFFGLRWLYNNTASGQRMMTDQKSNFNGGLDRIVTVYTANGDVIATYEGKIDIEGNDGGYILFDFEGKRYMYYNCFVESIANIG